MAGYIIYSLDWDKFRKFVERPTPGQLAALGNLLSEGLEAEKGEFDEDDPVVTWATDSGGLAQIAANRLAMPDWYGDLTTPGKNLWQGAIFEACMDCDDIDVGFRVDSDGVYWDVIELAWKQLGVVPGQISDVALSAFGTRPYRYHSPAKKVKSREQPGKDEADRRSSLAAISGMLRRFFETFKKVLGSQWEPMHSMHAPDEVQKMLSELQSLKSAMHNAREEDVQQQYEEELLPAIDSVAADGRMLFIQMDT